MKSGIIIFWSESEEILTFDYNNLDSIEEIISSEEDWGGEKPCIYNISPSVNKLGDGTVEVFIEYNHKDNKHLNFDDVSWGKSKITISPEKYFGEAEWFDSYNSGANGKVRWECLGSPLKSTNRTKMTTTKLQREQAKFRKFLMQLDEKCVLTGENTPTVLEAAHIIPVSECGTDVSENGIILRCDLHRLYDNGAFKFRTDGRVEVNVEKCSREYVELLTGASLPDKTLARVQRALLAKEA
ncbi:HNH endonuclease [Vibrio harveyi]|uniref:HNH endonuclease n=1 Tax=Vibrio harveyi TaxID=669 RepID=UPI004068B684